MEKIRLSELKRQIIHFVDHLDDELIRNFLEMYHGDLECNLPPVAKIVFVKSDSSVYVRRQDQVLYLSLKLKDLELFKLAYTAFWGEYFRAILKSNDLTAF